MLGELILFLFMKTTMLYVNDVAALCTPRFFTTFEMVARRELSAPKCNLFTRQCLQGFSKEPRGKSGLSAGSIIVHQEERVTPRDKFPPRVASTPVTQQFPLTTFFSQIKSYHPFLPPSLTLQPRKVSKIVWKVISGIKHYFATIHSSTFVYGGQKNPYSNRK